MGRNKLLLHIGGEPLVRRAARSALEAGLAPVLAVVGHQAAQAEAALAGLAVTPVVNPDHAQGISASLSAGVAAVPADAEALVVLLADMAFAGPEQIRAAVQRWRETGKPVVTSRYGEALAPPTLYAREMFPALQGGRGEGRGREVVRAAVRDGRAAFVDWPEDLLEDIDRPEDYQRARARAAGRRMT
jgi:molybdenum cofactor cytidylyltransferase